MLVRKANREDPDRTSQIGSALFVRVGLFGWQLVFQILEHLLYFDCFRAPMLTNFELQLAGFELLY